MISPKIPAIAHQLSFPKELNTFVGSPPAELPPPSTTERIEALEKAHMRSTRAMAKYIYHSEGDLKPDEDAKAKTKEAARDFFTSAYTHLTKEEPYPLAGYNKCIGMAVVPQTKLVLIALSEGREPKNDKPLRQKFLTLILKVNRSVTKWIFELVCKPTPSEYIILRTLSMREPDKAPKEWIQPRMRCAEVAIAVALCKAGRFKDFKPESQGIVTFGCSLFSSKQDDVPVTYFEGSIRNKKYLERESSSNSSQ